MDSSEQAETSYTLTDGKCKKGKNWKMGCLVQAQEVTRVCVRWKHTKRCANSDQKRCGGTTIANNNTANHYMIVPMMVRSPFNHVLKTCVFIMIKCFSCRLCTHAIFHAVNLSKRCCCVEGERERAYKGYTKRVSVSTRMHACILHTCLPTTAFIWTVSAHGSINDDFRKI